MTKNMQNLLDTRPSFEFSKVLVWHSIRRCSGYYLYSIFIQWIPQGITFCDNLLTQNWQESMVKPCDVLIFVFVVFVCFWQQWKVTCTHFITIYCQGTGMLLPHFISTTFQGQILIYLLFSPQGSTTLTKMLEVNWLFSHVRLSFNVWITC